MSKISIHNFHPSGWKDSETKKEILENVETDIKNNIKYILLEAPTGIGKSWIAATIALWQKEAVILTPQKVLQNQYEDNFEFMKIVKGKINFPCKQLDNEHDCSLGECNDCEYLPKKLDFGITHGRGTENEEINQIGNYEKDCTYWEQRKKGEIASFSVFNYAMFLQTQLNNNSFEEGPKKIRRILICDEAEQLEDKLSSELSLTLNENMAKIVSREDLKERIHNIETSTDVDYIKNIIGNLITEYDEQIEQLEEEMKQFLKKMDHKRIELLKNKKKLESTKDELKKTFSLMDKDWVVSEIRKKRNGNEVLLESVNIEEIAQKLFDQFEHVIFISATLNDDIFLKRLGIDRKITRYDDWGKFEIPKFNWGFPGGTILQKNGIDEGKITKIKDNDYFIEFSFEEKKFFARCEDFIPHESIPIIDENGKLNSLSKEDDDKKTIKNINRIFSSNFHTYDNPIAIENRKIEYVSDASWLYDAKKEELLPKMVKQIEEILNKHEYEKGIIHVTSFEYQKMILEKIGEKFLDRIECVIDEADDYDSEILNKVKKRKDKDELLKEHFAEDEPVVILSPSCWFGIDLKDDASRFQIIFKSPKPTLSTKNRTIQEKLEYGRDWYDMRTAYQLIQGCGRSVRSVNDKAITYLLDENCKPVLESNFVRPWFLESIK